MIYAIGPTGEAMMSHRPMIFVTTNRRTSTNVPILSRIHMI